MENYFENVKEENRKLIIYLGNKINEFEIVFLSHLEIVKDVTKESLR